MSSIPEIRSDIRALRAIVNAGVDVPDWAINAIWRWFFDQELKVPLPIMPLSEAERRDLAEEILSEMDERFVALEKQAESMTSEDAADLNQTDDGQKVNDLWRELAGCYAHAINSSVTVLTDEEEEIAYSNIISVLIASSGISEEELYQRIKHDGSTRMMLRRSGIDPDRLLGG